MNGVAELKNPLTPTYLDFKSTFTSLNSMIYFPWYFTISTLPDWDANNNNFLQHFNESNVLGILSHSIYDRPTKGASSTIGTLNGFENHGDQVNTIVKEILDFNNLEFNHLVRAAVNLDLPTGGRTSLAHVDNHFQHKVLLIHLSCGSDSGNTVLCQEKDLDGHHREIKDVTPIYELIPGEDRIFSFDGLQNHYQISGNKHIRITLVINYV